MLVTASGRITLRNMGVPQAAALAIEFRDWFRAALQRHHLIQADAAWQLGVHPATVARWCAWKGPRVPDYVTLVRIVQRFGDLPPSLRPGTGGGPESGGATRERSGGTTGTEATQEPRPNPGPAIVVLEEGHTRRSMLIDEVRLLAVEGPHGLHTPEARIGTPCETTTIGIQLRDRIET